MGVQGRRLAPLGVLAGRVGDPPAGTGFQRCLTFGFADDKVSTLSAKGVKGFPLVTLVWVQGPKLRSAQSRTNEHCADAGGGGNYM